MIIKIGIALDNTLQKEYAVKNFEAINLLFNLKSMPVFLYKHDLNSIVHLLLEKQIDCAILNSGTQPELMIDKLDWFQMPCCSNDSDNTQRLSDENRCSVIFNKDDKRFYKIRLLFCKVVTFIGSGIGNANMCSLAGLEALKNSEVCLHDSLIDYSILDNLPANAKIIDVGKRCSHHKMSQTAISDLIAKYARMGLRISRLKSGDPSIFGRLAEEIEILNSFHIPYRIIPGVSSLNAVSANTGIILTKRGVNRGFSVMSAIKHGGGIAPLNINERDKLPILFYMGVRIVGNIAKALIANSMSPQTKAVMVFGIGSENETVVRGDLENIEKKVNRFKNIDNLPGLFIVGDVTDYNLNKGLLGGKRILIAGCGRESDKIAKEIEDFGGIPIKYKVNMKIISVSREKLLGISKYDFILLDEVEASDSFIKTFIKANIDIRHIPPIISGTQTVTDFLKSLGILPAIEAHKIDEKQFLYEIRNKRLAYIHSKDINGKFATILKNNLIKPSNVVICENEDKNKKLPNFESVLFLDKEYFQKFIAQGSLEYLRGKNVMVRNMVVKNYLNQISINAILLESKKEHELVSPIIKSLFKSDNYRVLPTLECSSA